MWGVGSSMHEEPATVSHAVPARLLSLNEQVVLSMSATLLENGESECPMHVGGMLGSETAAVVYVQEIEVVPRETRSSHTLEAVQGMNVFAETASMVVVGKVTCQTETHTC